MKRINCLRIVSLFFVAGFCGSLQAAGDADAGKQKSQPCAACHGVAGVSANPAWPNLAGQGEKYLVDQLQLFKEKIRVNTLMNPQAENLSTQDMQDLDPDKEFQGEKLHVIGERIYRGGNSETGVPACMSCHAPDGVGNGPAKFPQLAGQHAVYTAAQLRAYKLMPLQNILPVCSRSNYQPNNWLA